MDGRAEGPARPDWNIMSARRNAPGSSCARDEFSTEELEAMRRQFQTRKAQLGARVA
jgi:hypothetical protein